MNIAAIKTLLETLHPVSGEWDADDALAAAQFNAKDIQHVRDSMSGEEVFAVTDKLEFAGLTEHEQQIWMAFCARSDIDPEGLANVDLVKWVFGEEGSTTLSNLGTARTESISLATQEGLGTVYPVHVTSARAYHA